MLQIAVLKTKFQNFHNLHTLIVIVLVFVYSEST